MIDLLLHPAVLISASLVLGLALTSANGKDQIRRAKKGGLFDAD